MQARLITVPGSARTAQCQWATETSWLRSHLRSHNSQASTLYIDGQL